MILLLLLIVMALWKTSFLEKHFGCIKWTWCYYDSSNIDYGYVRKSVFIHNVSTEFNPNIASISKIPHGELVENVPKRISMIDDIKSVDLLHFDLVYSLNYLAVRVCLYNISNIYQQVCKKIDFADIKDREDIFLYLYDKNGSLKLE